MCTHLLGCRRMTTDADGSPVEVCSGSRRAGAVVDTAPAIPTIDDGSARSRRQEALPLALAAGSGGTSIPRVLTTRTGARTHPEEPPGAFRRKETRPSGP